MTRAFTESIVEDAAPAWLGSIGWVVRNGAEMTHGECAAERFALRSSDNEPFNRPDTNLSIGRGLR